MSDTPISAREFSRFEDGLTKIFERQDKSFELMTSSIKGIETTLGELTEYQIHNNTRHDRTNEELKTLTQKDVDTNKRIDKHERAIVANTKVSAVWRTIGKYGAKILIAFLTTLGAIIAYAVFG